MCKRQIDRGLTPPAPSNDNEPRIVTGLMGLKPAFLQSGILSVVLEPTDRVGLELVADGILTIQGRGAVERPGRPPLRVRSSAFTRYG